MKSRDEVLADIGLGRRLNMLVARQLARIGEGKAPENASVVTIQGSEGMAVQFAKCCRPIPGDAIVGYLGRGEGLLVHTADCPTGKRLFERDSERWMQVDWAEDLTRPFETHLHVLVRNGKGVLAQVASAISASEADITHLDMDPEPGDESTELRLLVSVRDRVHLADVLRGLRRSSVVLKVARGK